jgi:hypothetical protein
MTTLLTSSSYGFTKLENRVPVASKQVLVSHLRVLMSRLGVPVASRRVPIGYEFTPGAGQVDASERLIPIQVCPLASNRSTRRVLYSDNKQLTPAVGATRVM